YSFMGSEVPRGNSEEMTSFRRENIGYVFQFFNLLQDLTVIENVSLIQELAGNKDKSRAEELLRLVGLYAESDRFPGEISGGQQQRVAIARSIAKRPTLLLGDELTGNLDTETSDKVMQVLVEACEKENITAILVTHDESLIAYATRVIRIDSGRIVSDEKTISSEKATIS
ncbi:MAG TPA: ATP-binding cassette domain-containing protein, partial [Candidatus Poseidoniales archaeon]